MRRIKLHDKYFIEYLNRVEIDKGVTRVANKLNNKFKGCDTTPLIISVMNGAFIFTSDLLKKLDFMCDTGFIKASSYIGIERSNTITIDWNSCPSVKDRDIIISDEIIDSGCTMAWLKENYIKKGAKSVTIATLIYKPHTMKVTLDVDCYGIKMEDNAFLVGYGLDYNEKGRSLCEIYILDKDE